MNEPIIKSYHYLQSQLRSHALSLRTHRRQLSESRPRYAEADQYYINGQLYKRYRIIVTGHGCSRPFCTMCPFPNEAMGQSRGKLSNNNVVMQIKRELNDIDNPEIVCIYNDGSFFSDAEIPPISRASILRLIKRSKAKMLMVESLPEFIDENSIKESLKALGDNVQLIVGVGLQSSNRIIRELCIATSVTEEVYRNAINILNKYNIGIKTYLMFKPPFLTEEEACNDVIESAIFAGNFHPIDITICPTRIVPGTVVYDLYSRNLYFAPALVSLAASINVLRSQGLNTRVSLFNVASSDIPSITPVTCQTCGPINIKSLFEYSENLDKDSKLLTYCSSCSKYADQEHKLDFFNQSLVSRVNAYLDLLKGKNMHNQIESKRKDCLETS